MEPGLRPTHGVNDENSIYFVIFPIFLDRLYL